MQSVIPGAPDECDSAPAVAPSDILPALMEPPFDPGVQELLDTAADLAWGERMEQDADHLGALIELYALERERGALERALGLLRTKGPDLTGHVARQIVASMASDGVKKRREDFMRRLSAHLAAE